MSGGLAVFLAAEDTGRSEGFKGRHPKEWNRERELNWTTAG